MSVENRIRELREYKAFNQKDFGEILGLTLSNVSQIEREKAKASVQLIRKIVDSFKVSATWLLTGEGEMFLSSGEQETAKPSLGYLEEVFATKEELADVKVKLKKLRGSLTMSDNMIKIILKRLGKIEIPEHERAYHRLVESLAEEDEEEEEEPETTCRVLDVGLAAAAGPLRELDTIEDYIDVPESVLPKNRKGIFVGRIEGDSMRDIIPDGARVLLRVCSEPQNGKVYVFSLRGCATIKKFHLDDTGPHFDYLDGSGRSIYPEKSEKWYCNAEFLRVL